MYSLVIYSIVNLLLYLFLLNQVIYLDMNWLLLVNSITYSLFNLMIVFNFIINFCNCSNYKIKISYVIIASFYINNLVNLYFYFFTDIIINHMLFLIIIYSFISINSVFILYKLISTSCKKNREDDYELIDQPAYFIVHSLA